MFVSHPSLICPQSQPDNPMPGIGDARVPGVVLHNPVK